MIEYTRQPIFFNRNRVKRVYQGGQLLEQFLGGSGGDTEYPEEWLASAVCALNGEELVTEGLSVISGTEITLKELFARYPDEMLGGAGDLGLLVKYLDSAIRLPVQAHPDRAFSERYLNSIYGKAEMWLVLATREEAGIYFGFKDKISKEEFALLIEESKNDKDIMARYLNKVEVKPGDVFMIPAKAVHAIGYGCLMLEVQEPTDFTIQPEYWCGDYLLNNEEMYLGLSKQVALECFDYTVYGSESVALSRKRPHLLVENQNYKKEALISFSDTPCFAVEKYTIYQNACLQYAPAVYVVIAGRGIVVGKGYEREIGEGDHFFLPWNGRENAMIIAAKGDTLEVVACIPPAKN